MLAALQGEEGGGSARSVVIALMLILPLISMGLVVFGGLRLKGLLKRIPRITTKKHLEAYAAEYKLHDMLGVLIKSLLGAANALFVVDLFILGGPITDLFYSITPSLISILVSLPFRPIEQRASDVECATEDLRREWAAARQG